jgi:hypothetical protein
MAIRFHDVSHHNGDYHPDGPTLAKATEGLSFIDERYTTTRARTLAGGWPFAGYHFLDGGNPDGQAVHAFSVIGRTPAMLDVEEPVTGRPPTLAETVAFVDHYRDLGGVLNVLYLPRWFWAGRWGSPSLAPLAARGLALISSNYTLYTDTGPGWAPYGGMVPAIWQYTSTPIDTSAFRGTVDELRRLFAGGGGAPDQGVDMTTVDLTPAAIAAVRDAILAAPIFVRPAGEQTTDGLSLAWAARGAYIRAGQVANVDDPAGAAAIAAIQQAVAGLPAAVAAAVAALPGAAPGAELTAADVETAVAEVLGRASASFIVAPPVS